MKPRKLKAETRDGPGEESPQEQKAFKFLFRWNIDYDGRNRLNTLCRVRRRIDNVVIIEFQDGCTRKVGKDAIRNLSHGKPVAYNELDLAPEKRNVQKKFRVTKTENDALQRVLAKRRHVTLNDSLTTAEYFLELLRLDREGYVIRPNELEVPYTK